jgi:hypothetical protein
MVGNYLDHTGARPRPYCELYYWIWNMKTHCYLVFAFAFIIGLLVTVRGALADGLDMWSGEMQGLDPRIAPLFVPHKNSGNTACDANTEVFVTMGQNGTGGNTGYCIEKDQRSADYYDNARQTCAGLGKRLSEVVEFIFACVNYGGSLNNMTDDQEWAGNIPTTQSYASSFQGAFGNTVGNTGCRKAAMGVIGDYYLSAATYTFRCVH